MSDLAIQAEELGKKYSLKHQGNRKDGLRHLLQNALTSPWKLFRGGIQKKAHETPASNEDFWALKNVSFEIKQGEVVGIIGRNGAGKSTLLKILSRIIEPTTGRVKIDGRVASLLEVGTGFHPELTGRENIYLNGTILGMTRQEIKRKFDEIVAFAEIEKFLDTPVKHYSSGMYVRLAFAVAAHLEPEILVVDEVLAVGDAQFQKKCLGKMQDVSKREGRTVLFVSHNTGAVLSLCQRGIVLQHGKLVCDQPVEQAVEFYNRSLARDNHSGESREPHVLFDDSRSPKRGDLAITKVEILDKNNQPKATVGTWDDLVIRVWYRSIHKIERGSIIFQLTSTNGARMFTLSTQPDSNLPMDILPGVHAVDCIVEELPLSAGEYMIGLGLGVPYMEMLWWQADLAMLTVCPRDVFGSGLAPVATRSLIAPRHYWQHHS